MCTLIVGFYPGSEYPLIVGSNRDENPTRPSETWKRRDGGIFCPLDVRGGTWIGCNDQKIFCAVTNWDIEKKFTVRKSRGDVVLNSLMCRSLDEVGCLWATMKAADYRPFNLLVGNHKQLWHLSCDGEEFIIDKLEPGLHIATGWGVDVQPPREIHIRKYLRQAFHDFSQPVSSLATKEVLLHHNDPGDDAVCVHDDSHEWETVSSAHLQLYRNKWVIEHCIGHPCKVNFDEWVIDMFETTKGQV